MLMMKVTAAHLQIRITRTTPVVMCLLLTISAQIMMTITGGILGIAICAQIILLLPGHTHMTPVRSHHLVGLTHWFNLSYKISAVTFLLLTYNILRNFSAAFKRLKYCGATCHRLLHVNKYITVSFLLSCNCDTFLMEVHFHALKYCVHYIVNVLFLLRLKCYLT